ncbi:MAG TPA: ABC transporter permease [Solirubrobacteraceae bacterium]|nr:ABC transporter permease [Solirubrobacteraceae bacterium]
MNSERLLALSRRPSAFAVTLAIGLIIVNVIVQPDFAASGQIAPTLGTLAPFALAGMASTPAFLAGGGGIDLSIAPLMGFTNILLVTKLFGTALGGPLLAIPILLLIGAGVGALNGLIVTRLRIPPVIATLAMYFVLSGVDLDLVPNPVTAEPNWTSHLAGSIGPVPGAIVIVGVPLLLWVALRRTPFVESLLSVGDHDATAFSSGMNVDAVRIAAYALGGMIAGAGGIALTGLVQSADSQVFGDYVLVALAAVALGGTNMAGGRGGMFLSLVGAASIFLLENVLTNLHASAYFIQVAYGGVLLIAILLGTGLFNRRPEARR